MGQVISWLLGSNETLERLEDEARKREEEVGKKMEEYTKKLKELEKHVDDARNRAVEAKKREDEAKEREREARKREDDAKEQAKDAKTREDEAKKREDEAKKREEEARKREEEARKREEEAKEREEEAKKLKEEVEILKEEMKNSSIGPSNMPTTGDITRAKEKHKYNDKCVNIAVCGRTRTGKSSLINAFRGIYDDEDHPQIARVGITETTKEPTSYTDPNPTKPFIWYDFPGAGTLDIPEWNYFNEQGLFIFDFIIVLFKDTLAETDIAILRECTRFNIPSYLVRSHADDDIKKVLKQLPGYDRRNDSNNNSLRKKALERYREDTKKNVVKILEKAGITQRKFYRISRDNITAIVQNEEPYSDIVDEDLLLKDILKEIVSRRVWISDEMKTL